MINQKKFLILAIGVGAIGLIIGGISIWLVVSDLLQP